jgi:hypothetical protein
LVHRKCSFVEERQSLLVDVFIKHFQSELLVFRDHVFNGFVNSYILHLLDWWLFELSVAICSDFASVLFEFRDLSVELRSNAALARAWLVFFDFEKQTFARSATSGLHQIFSLQCFWLDTLLTLGNVGCCLNQREGNFASVDLLC